MTESAAIGNLLESIGEASPAGFAIALHIQFTSPRYLFQGYRREWIEHYSRNGLVLSDPTVRWGFENLGMIRWSDLAKDDAAGVLESAAAYGLSHGFTAAIERSGSRSVASFARGDREFDDAEMAGIEGLLAQLHDSTLGAKTLSPGDHAVLRRISVFLTHG